MYEYDIVNETVRFLDYARVDGVHLKAVVTPDDKIYYCKGGDGGTWCMDWKSYRRTHLSDTQFSIISVTNDGSYASGYYMGSGADRTLARLDLKTDTIEYLYKDFKSENPASAGIGHPQPNPEYPALEFFCNEGETTLIPDRLWLADWDSGEMYNMYRQKRDTDGSPIVHCGHEVWGMNGEKMYWVNYTSTEDESLRGLVRSDKYGYNVEYINADYPYWHCYPSGDDEWIAADTSAGQIILVDIDTKKSYYLAKFDMRSWSHPYQPHPVISRSGNVVGWQMADENNVVGCAWQDISDITGE